MSLQAINSASKPHAARIPKCHLMVSGGLRAQEKNVYFLKGVYSSSLEDAEIIKGIECAASASRSLLQGIVWMG